MLALHVEKHSVANMTSPDMRIPYTLKILLPTTVTIHSEEEHSESENEEQSEAEASESETSSHVDLEDNDIYQRCYERSMEVSEPCKNGKIWKIRGLGYVGTAG